MVTEWRSDEDRRLARNEKARAYRRGVRSPVVVRPVAERLLAKLDRVYGDVPAHAPWLGPCWPWTGALNGNDYGVIRGEREDGAQPLLLVHRVSLSLALGRPLAEGMVARHRCDNSRCGRPSHLHEGTQQENVADMNERGRAVRPPIRRKVWG